MKTLAARRNRHNTVSFLYRFDGRDLRIALSPARPVAQMYVSRPTDEGFEAYHARLELVGRTIVSSYRYDGMDCDGRLSGGSEAFCLVRDRAVATPIAPPGQRDRRRFPRWQHRSGFERDHAAERAGY